MNEPHVWTVCLLGMAIFGVGVFAGGYMMLRTGRWKLAASMDQYRQENPGSRWPSVLVYVCVPLGIIIVFGAIMLSN